MHNTWCGSSLDRMKSLSTKTSIAYGSLTIPLAAVGMPIGVYLPPLYATELGLGLATVGFVFMLARVWDVITDPVMGLLIDRFPGRWGRRKHWIVLGAPILMLSAWFLYLPGRAPATSWYLFASLFFLYIGYTLIDVAHKSWAADLATEYDDRSRLFGWREIINNLGTIGVLLLPVVIDQFFDADAFDRTMVMGGFLILTLPLAILVVVRTVPDHTARTVSAAPFKPAQVFSALRNPIMLRLFVTEGFVSVLPGTAGAMFLFVAAWVFDLEKFGSLGLIAFFVSGVSAVPLWVWLSTHLGKHGALVAATLYSAGTILLFLLADDSGSLPVFLGLTALVGVGFTGPQVLIRSMIADAVDQEEARSGENRAGLYFSFTSTVYKLGNALSVGLSYFVLDLVGFDPAGSNNEAAIQGLLLTFISLPAVFSLLTAACMWRYPLGKAQHESIRKSLSSRD